MAGKSSARRVRQMLDTLQDAEDPVARLTAARALREAADELELSCVAAARRDGVTWTEIGRCYGLTKQGAQQRFRVFEDKAETGGPVPAKGRRRRRPADGAGVADGDPTRDAG
jgi:hypothetical protein